MHNSAPIKVLVAIRLSQASWRDFLCGFLDTMRAHPRWSIKIIDPMDAVKVMAEGPADGIIVGDLEESVAAHLARLTLPTVVVGSQSTSIISRKKNLVFIHNDDEDIGREGARQLCALGMHSVYAFVPQTGSAHWSELRAKGFVSEMKSIGRKYSVFRLPRFTLRDDIHARLLHWMQALPKPAAVMAASDATAVMLSELCKTAKISVPEQFAILGVDNDRLLCESSNPALSSIAPDHFHEGRIAATALAKLLNTGSSKPKTILCTRKKAVIRESTHNTKPAVILLRRATKFISENSTSKISAVDVARHLGVSRQLIELRFREFGEMTLAATIRDIRLKEVRRQLRTTKLPIRAIAANCGWANVNHLENAFKRRFNVTMRECRIR